MILGSYTIAKIYLIPHAETDDLKFTTMFIAGLVVSAIIIKEGKGKR